MIERRKRRRIALPPRPFLAGTFTFPFSRGALARTLILAAAALAAGLLARETTVLLASADGRMTVLGAMFTVLTVFATVSWFAFAAACAVAVVGDTASGCDRIEHWPGPVFLDWLGEALSLASAVGIGVAPLAFLAWLSGDRGSAATAGVGIGFFFLFPVVLLSLLENGSLVDPVSPPVLRTLFVAPVDWLAFLLSTALLVLAAATIVAVALAPGSVVGIAGAGAAASVAWLAYFRLLGRLALVCSERVDAAERLREADAERER